MMPDSGPTPLKHTPLTIFNMGNVPLSPKMFPTPGPHVITPLFSSFTQRQGAGATNGKDKTSGENGKT